MPRRFAIALSLVLVLLASARAGAWGSDAHRFVTAEAVALLPADLRPFFEKHRAFLAEHSIDPDLWRIAGFEDEPPRHFLDLDAYGQPPFPDLPRDYDVAVLRYGTEFVQKNGVLPWRTTEIYGNLVRAFEDVKKGTAPWALENVKFHAAVLAHYVGDAHVPLHALVNYDGQLSNQHGVHARFESDLFARYRSRLVVRPAAAAPVSAPRQFMFDTLLASFSLAGPLLEADKAALGEGSTYDEAYYARYFEAVRPTLERRLGESASAIAAMITGAWEKAGRPAVPLEMPQRLRTRRAPATK